MQRILVVVHEPIDKDDLRRRCAVDVAEPYEVAVCRVLPAGHDGLEHSLRAQKELTAALREMLGARAEEIAILIASDAGGYRVDDCARDWGATIVDA